MLEFTDLLVVVIGSSLSAPTTWATVTTNGRGEKTGQTVDLRPGQNFGEGQVFSLDNAMPERIVDVRAGNRSHHARRQLALRIKAKRVAVAVC
jgi:hypothetical protein